MELGSREGFGTPPWFSAESCWALGGTGTVVTDVSETLPAPCHRTLTVAGHSCRRRQQFLHTPRGLTMEKHVKTKVTALQTSERRVTVSDRDCA